jgi:N-methylhydantoinase A
MAARARLGVDVGGTFTDVVLERAGERVTAKLLTTPAAPERAVLDGVNEASRKAGLAPAEIGLIVHGTTLVTNALIERKGAPTALVTTQGFRDVLEMGTESRFEQYDLAIEKPAPLVPRRRRFVVRERTAVTGEVLVPLEEAELRRVAGEIAASGAVSVAICFLHAYANPAHERRAREVLADLLPQASFSLSGEVAPEIREYDRFSTTAANAYVQPLIESYLARLEESLRAAGYACPLMLMLSGSGLTDAQTARRFPIRLIESGPAGGVVLAADIARRAGLGKVMALDMGGTTAKFALIDDGVAEVARSFEFGRVFRFKKGSGLPLRVPSVQLVEIGAGGGSIAQIDALRNLAVGPDSAGADPGPACYGRGGAKPTVTDANLALGRIAPEGFAGGRIAVDAAAARRALADAVGAPLRLADEAAAAAIVEVVDEAMANAARQHGIESGKSLPGRTLIAFGGSAPLHAARLADKLEIDRILVPAGAGVASAIGFLRAPVAFEVTRSVQARLGRFEPAKLNRALGEMAAEAQAIVARAAPGAPIAHRRLAYMRYAGQGHEIPVPLPPGELDSAGAGRLRADYEAAYRAQYSRTVAHVDIEIVGLALIATAAPPQGMAQAPAPRARVPPRRRRLVDPATLAARDVPVHRRESLAPGQVVEGPALIEEDDTTTVVGAGFVASLERDGHILLVRRNAGDRA